MNKTKTPSKIKFTIEALKNFKTIGCFLPTQRYLAKKMASWPEFNNAKKIIELGAGDGAVTYELIRSTPKSCEITCIECSDKFADILENRFGDKINVIRTRTSESGNRPTIEEYFNNRSDELFDAVISSLPMAQIPRKTVLSIMNNAKKILRPGGVFIQYQYSPKNWKDIKNIFDESNIDFVPLNIPPAFVYRGMKKR